MIKIVKSVVTPSILQTKGKEKRKSLCSLYSRFSKDYINGIRKFEFDTAIYSDRSVKQELVQAQYGKCAFCESKLAHISYGDVEHFRPKGGYQQSNNETFTQPGYYWLAYDWDNLLLSCTLCNQRHKRNLFPISNPIKRAKTHKDDINQESPLFIHPAKDNPEQYISFHKHIAYSINNNERGTETIKGLGLNRPELSNFREDYYTKLYRVYQITTLKDSVPEEVIVDAEKEISNAIKESEQYSSMAKAAIKAQFLV